MDNMIKQGLKNNTLSSLSNAEKRNVNGGVSDADVNAFSAMLEEKTEGKDSTKEAIYSEKDEKKAYEEKLKQERSDMSRPKLSESKQRLYNYSGKNMAALSMGEKSAMGLNANGVRHQQAPLNLNQLQIAMEQKNAAGKNAALNTEMASEINKADKAEKLDKKASAKQAAGEANANVSAQTTDNKAQAENTVKQAEKTEQMHAKEQVKREEVIKQIMNHVELKNFANKTELTIKMNPEFLGAMKMRLLFEGDKVSAEFNTTSQALREIIAESKEELMGAMSDKGMKVGKVDVHLVDNEDVE